MPVHHLPYVENTLEIANHFRAMPYFVMLDSGHQGPDIVSAYPVTWVLQTSDHDTQQLQLLPTGVYQASSSQEDVISLLKKLHHDLPRVPVLDGKNTVSSDATLWHPCIMGTLSYESGYGNNYLSELMQSQSYDYALRQFGSYCWAIVTDHKARFTHLHIGDNCPPWLESHILQALNETPVALAPFRLQEPFSPQTDKSRYLNDIERILNYIHAGDCYQANYTQKFCAPCTGDAWDAYQQLRALSPTPFGAFLDAGNEQILSHSPERFIQIQNRQMATQPIKGTAKRGNTDAEDRALATGLLNSPKDRAENVMIVDLLRNDLGRSAIPGSVKVPSLFSLASFLNVHHLVSTVTATLLPALSPIDSVLRAFPGGSITGAPKKRAMEIIHELEPRQRGPYCGSFFYWNAANDLDSSILIRTLVVKQGTIAVWGGGGIVVDSVAEQEYQESLAKVGYLMAALEAINS